MAWPRISLEASLTEVPQIDAAFIPVIGYYMTENI
jgi:hypothetical protein